MHPSSRQKQSRNHRAFRGRFYILSGVSGSCRLQPLLPETGQVHTTAAVLSPVTFLTEKEMEVQETQQTRLRPHAWPTVPPPTEGATARGRGRHIAGEQQPSKSSDPAPTLFPVGTLGLEWTEGVRVTVSRDQDLFQCWDWQTRTPFGSLAKAEPTATFLVPTHS